MPASASRAARCFASRALQSPAALGCILRHPMNAACLHEPGASFVTLKTARPAARLHRQPHRRIAALADDVRENARAAAFHDPRFAPLRSRSFAPCASRSRCCPRCSLIDCTNEAEAAGAAAPRHRRSGRASTARVAAPFCRRSGSTFPSRGGSWPSSSARRASPSIFWDAEVRLSRYSVAKWSEPEHR